MALNSGWTYHDRPKTQLSSLGDPLTVWAYYCQHYTHSSPQDWHDRILSGQIHRNGQPTTPDALLQVGDRLTYHRPPWSEPEVPLNFEILYQDSDLWIINKPSGLPVLPGGAYLTHTLLHQLQQRFPGETLTPLHRLGRGTSGLMVIARSSLARSALSHAFRQRQLTKIYRALVTPDRPSQALPDRFICTQAIGPVSHGNGTVHAALDPSDPQSRSAHSEGWVLQRSAQHTLVTVQIFTGRPHQIRIHMASLGSPLLGDPLYTIGGVPKSPALGDPLPLPGDCGYWLHAYELGFAHPRSGQWCAWTQPVPANWPRCDRAERGQV